MRSKMRTWNQEKSTMQNRHNTAGTKRRGGEKEITLRNAVGERRRWKTSGDLRTATGKQS